MYPPAGSASDATVERPLKKARPRTTDRLNEHLMALGSDRLAALGQSVAKTAFTEGAWKEHDGLARALPVTLRPRVVRLARHGYVHHVAWQVRLALTRLGKVYVESERARRALLLEDGERAWLERHGRPGMTQRLFARLDAIGSLDTPRWKSTFKVIEPNVIGIGGMRYSAAAEEALIEHVAPLLSEREPELVLERNPDPRGLLLGELLSHARSLRRRRAPAIALIDDRSLYRLGGEMAALAEWMREQGVDAMYADPRELAVGRDGSVACHGRAIDVVYRFLDLRELAEMEAAGADLSGVHRAFETGRMVPGACADLEHKSAFEVFTDPQFERAFSREQRRVLSDHVLWTRLLRARRTTAPNGAEVDLPEWTRENRRELVIKPNRSYGGEGVVIGEAVDEGAWASTIERGLAEPDSLVVQLAGPSCVERFPFVDDCGQPSLEPRFTSLGLYTASGGLGIFGRVARTRVVNLAAGAVVSPVLVEVR
jgi:hypothetical protein